MSDDTENKEDPKIIIDEDWKSQVEAEKAAAEDQRDETPAESPPEEPGEEPADNQFELPPASFSLLVSSLATQALAALGQMPGPDGKPMHEPVIAKHHIDTLGVLQEKTKGNLDGDEIVMLNNVLHELRMAYVNLSQQAPPQSPS
ncbi:MAG TPA: DUF1844 domain-containing protein [Planctomycetaceae bacterium]|nr:hypothetical protein [Blastopirellula sp.]HAY82218.1 DUF1844 domain-containing protein [Planctomycetaceae bacterium]